MDSANALQPDYQALAELAKKRVLSEQDLERLGVILTQNPLPLERYHRALEWLWTKPLVEVKEPSPLAKMPVFDKLPKYTTFEHSKKSGKTSAQNYLIQAMEAYVDPGDVFDMMAEDAKSAAEVMDETLKTIADALDEKQIKFEVTPPKPWSDENSDPLADILVWKKKYMEMYCEPYDKGHMNHGGFHNPAPKVPYNIPYKWNFDSEKVHDHLYHETKVNFFKEWPYAPPNFIITDV